MSRNSDHLHHGFSYVLVLEMFNIKKKSIFGTCAEVFTGYCHLRKSTFNIAVVAQKTRFINTCKAGEDAPCTTVGIVHLDFNEYIQDEIWYDCWDHDKS